MQCRRYEEVPAESTQGLVRMNETWKRRQDGQALDAQVKNHTLRKRDHQSVKMP